MRPTKLMHCLIVTDRLDETRDFYVRVLGLTQGPRPFAPPGYWLYLGRDDVIHLAGDNSKRRGVVERAAALSQSFEKTVGKVEHIALGYEGYDGLIEKLLSEKINFHERSVHHLNQHQVFLADPNGVGIELNFVLEPLLASPLYQSRN